MSEPLAEIGLPITKLTRCRVGVHMWMWAGSAGTSPEQPPDMLLRCDCGLYSWQERPGTQEAKA